MNIYIYIYYIYTHIKYKYRQIEIRNLPLPFFECLRVHPKSFQIKISSTIETGLEKSISEQNLLPSTMPTLDK